MFSYLYKMLNLQPTSNLYTCQLTENICLFTFDLTIKIRNLQTEFNDFNVIL